MATILLRLLTFCFFVIGGGGLARYFSRPGQDSWEFLLVVGLFAVAGAGLHTLDLLGLFPAPAPRKPRHNEYRRYSR